MKIGFDAKRAFHNLTGLGVYSRNLLTALFKNNPENEYFLYTPKKGSFDFCNAGKNIHIKSNNFIPGFIWRKYSIGKSILKEKLDIYHGLSAELPNNSFKSKARKIVTIHDLIYLRFADLYPKIDRHFYQKKTQFALNAADVVIAISENTKTDILNYYKINEEKVKVVHQHVNDAFFHKTEGQEIDVIKNKFNLNSPYILSVSSFTKRKNQKSLIKAFNKIKDSIDHQLIIVGSGGSELMTLKKFIKELGLEKSVVFIENIELEDLPAIYQNAALFVNCSLYEGFGLPIAEALASGTPVLSNSGSCFEETGGPGSAYYQENDKDSNLSESLLMILSSEQLRVQMSKYGKQYAERYRSKNHAEKVMKIYSDLL